MRRALLAFALALVAFAVLPAITASGAKPPACGPAPSGTSQTFEYREDPYSFRVPPGVTKLTIDAQGGHGGQFHHTANGGAGGVITGTVPVNSEECLTVYVGEFGYGHGGNGWSHGGDHGVAPGSGEINGGHSGAGGGGASAVVRGETPLAVAGGGGGGGGDAGNDSHHYGGEGGDGGAGQSSSNFNQGEGGASGDNNVAGGCAGCEHGGHGGAGHDTGETDASESGAGGGGGGGINGGGGGEAGYTGPVVDVNGGGGGGGAGSSGGISSVNWHFYASSRTHHGLVQLSWQLVPARAEAGGGSQETEVDEEFEEPLTVRVTDAAGDPLDQVRVTFESPEDDASGSFRGHGREFVTETNDEGLATSPYVTANAIAGNWTAEARVAGLATPVRYALTNRAAETSTSLTSSSQPSLSGEPVVFTARVRSPAGGLRPRGAVEFSLDGERLATGVLDANGVAVAPAQTFLAGVHHVQATYMGDQSFAASTSPEFSQQVEKGETGLKLTSSANPAEDGETVVFTAAVSVQPPAAGIPTGSVQFEVDGTSLGAPVALAADGTAGSPPVTGLAVGSHAVSATYSGDSQFEGAGGSFTESVGPDATAAEIVPSVSPAYYGELLRLTGLVRTHLQAPTGELRFLVDGGQVCAAPLRAPTPPAVDAVAECALSQRLAAGEHQLEVVYDGNTDFKPATGSATLKVVPARTVTTLSSNPGDPAYGGALTLRARVASRLPSTATPGGGVLFSVDGNLVGPPAALDDEGRAELQLSQPLAAGPHLVSAEYAGAAGFGPSSDGIPLPVARAATVTTIASSANPSAPGEAVSFLASVDVLAPGGGAPGGSVQFMVDDRRLGLPVPVADGKAEIRAGPSLRTGTRLVTAHFSGDGSYAPSHAEGDQRVESKPSAGAPATQPAALPALSPHGTAKVLGKRVRMTHAGWALIVVRCSGARGALCADRLKLRAARKYPGLGVTRGERLGGAWYRLPAGTTKRVAVRLGAGGRSVLVRFGRLQVRTELSAAEPASTHQRPIELVAVPSPGVIVDNSRVRVFANGRLRLRVYCDTDRSLRCRAGLTIRDDFERLLAARDITLTGDRHRTVTLRSPALRRLARDGVDVRAIAATISTSPAGPETVRHRRLTLLPAGGRDAAGRR